MEGWGWHGHHQVRLHALWGKGLARPEQQAGLQAPDEQLTVRPLAEHPLDLHEIRLVNRKKPCVTYLR